MKTYLNRCTLTTVLLLMLGPKGMEGSCPSGHYCPTAEEQIPCPKGFYNPNNDSTDYTACIACPGGKYCATEGISSPTASCYPGYYCPGANIKAKPMGRLCHPNKRCPWGTTTPNRCYNTQYQPGSGNMFCRPCPLGHFCYYGYMRGKCDDGYKCDLTRNTQRGDACNKGHYCLSGQGVDIPCPPGTMQRKMAEKDCQPCPVGKYCATEGLETFTGSCADGWWCGLNSTTATPPGQTCPQGHRCTNGSKIECGKGQFQPNTGQQNCSVCPVGMYCGALNTVSPTDCAQGQCCHEGFTEATSCHQGDFLHLTYAGESRPTFNEANALCTAQGPKYKLAVIDTQEEYDRMVTWFLETSSYVADGLLPSGVWLGAYWISGVYEWDMCFASTSLTWGLWDTSQNSTPNSPMCLILNANNKFQNVDCGSQYDILCEACSSCDRGSFYYIPEGSFGGFCLLCPAGSYCATKGLLAPSGVCEDGWYCLEGSIYPNQEKCPTGSYCSGGIKRLCGAGSYQPLDGQSECMPCPAGRYCESEGLDHPSGLCFGGFACPSGVTKSNWYYLQCPIGHYCPTGSATPIPCKTGWFTSKRASGSCGMCPVGHYCDKTEAEAEQQSGVGYPTHGVVTPKVCPPYIDCIWNNTSTPTCNDDPYVQGVLDLSISCSPNCDLPVSSQEGLEFTVACSNCGAAFQNFTWSVRQCFGLTIDVCGHCITKINYIEDLNSPSFVYSKRWSRFDVTGWTNLAVVVKVVLVNNDEGMTYNIYNIWQHFDPWTGPVNCVVTPEHWDPMKNLFNISCDPVAGEGAITIEHNIYAYDVLLYQGALPIFDLQLPAPNLEDLPLHLEATSNSQFFYHTDLTVKIPVDGGYTEWTLWGNCTQTCGTGSQTRSRDCTNPIPQYGGAACLGDPSETQYCNTDPCPIDGGYTEWTLWSTCTQTCGTGSQTRSRDCTNPIPQYGGTACLGDPSETQDCNTDLCPIDGGYTEWTVWGTCTQTCGTGHQTRSRDCTNPIPQYGGAACLGDLSETQDCNTDPCPINGGYTQWTMWGTCTQTCETGSQTRSRDCINPIPQYGGATCLLDPSETQNCNTDPCPINGGYTQWTMWGTCTQTCGTGSQTRSRDCINPIPQYGGAACLGDPSETQDCNTDPCPIDGGYTEWTVWGTCTQTCGTGRQTRSRDCTNPIPQYGGASCLGDPSETQDCNTDPCPIDGGYTEWTVWGTCTQTCGTGRQTKSRDCINPIPQYGGAACLLHPSETQDCNTDPCPINGGYTQWTMWGTCTQTCGTGSQTRSRDCINPIPQYGGAACLLDSSETQDCNTDPCPIDGGYTEWTLWDTCTQTCGTGSQTRSRDCTNPIPKYGGAACLGDPSETQDCNADPCPIDGDYTEWTVWSTCTQTCGTGSQTRSRDCANPIPQYGGAACLGDPSETQDCNIDPCPINGGYTQWTMWGTCTQTCGTGRQTRSRDCINPIPQYGGAACLGDPSETQDCNTDSCPIDGGYTEWTVWGTCTQTCGTGSQTRSRDCINPIPQYGGAACLLHPSETQGCNTDSCPINGGYTQWTMWVTCTQTCGTGSQTRSRECTNPFPQYGGAACLLDPSATQDCNTDPCPIDGGYTEWTLWGTCTHTCGTGSQTRSRDCTNPIPHYGGAACLGHPSESQNCYADPCPDPYDPGTLRMQLSCVPRCTSLMSSAEVTNLHTVCQDCLGDVSGYTWTLRQCHSYNVEDCDHFLHQFYVVNNSSSSIQYDPANPGHQVSDWTHLGIFVKVKLTDGNQGMTYHILRLFDPASPPVPCRVTPTTGISLSTLYSVFCEDVDTPEVYNITYSLYNHVSLQVVVYKGGTANVSEILLPAGYEGSENTVNLQMVARIQGHLFYLTEIPVQVKPAAIDDMMKNFNIGNASDTEHDGASVIDQQLEKGNVFAAVRMLESVAEVLNHASDGENATQENGTSSQSGTKTETQGSETLVKYRTQVTKSVSKINISNYELVSTVSVVLNKVTAKSEELSEEAREIATGTYSNLAESLAQSLLTSQEDVSEKEVTNTAGAILQGAGAMIAMYTDAFEKETKPSESDKPEKTSGTQTTIKPATQNTAKTIEMTEKLLKTVNTVCDALMDRQIQDAKPTVIMTDTIQISVQKLSPSKLGGAQIEVGSPRGGTQASRVTMPQSLGLSSTTKDYRLRTVVMNKNPYVWTANASQVKTPVISITLRDSDNNIVDVTGLEQPVKLSIPAEFNTNNAQRLKQRVLVDKKDDSLDLTSDHFSTSKAALSFPLISNKVTLLRFAMPVNLKELKVHINETSSLNLQDLLQDDTHSTQVSAFLKKFGDHMGNDSSSSFIVFFIPSSSFDLGSEDAEINLGLSLHTGDNKTMQALGHRDPNCEGNKDLVKCQGYLETEVSFSIHTMQCLYWDETMQAWSTAGCSISTETSDTSLGCECDHLSAFAGSILFLPSAIDPIQDLVLFLTVFENPVVVTTVLIVWMIYVFLLLWARRADREDEKKEGVVKCAGSSPSDRYGYLVCVVTGWWRHAGTTANVFFYIKDKPPKEEIVKMDDFDGRCSCTNHKLLSGTLGESPRTSLTSSFRKCLQSGSEDWFLLTTKFSLGNLRSMTLWHDNSGTSPQWFLNRVFVKDIQRGVSWMFLCNDWLAVDIGLLGLTSITIEPISEEQLRFRQKFNFLLQATSNLREGHIWMSVFTRPSGNWFTRVQRLSCCLSILLTTMLSDLMFTGIPTDNPEDQLTAGAFRLSVSQLAIGIWSSIIVFPINFIIIQLFMKSRPKPKPHCVKTDPFATNPLATEHLATGGSPLQQSSELDDSSSFESHTTEKMESSNLAIPDNEMVAYGKGSASGKNLPWWCLIIAWCLVILVTVVCSYFVMLYGLKYGYTRSFQWLVSFLTGFFHSILIQEPVKAVALASIFIFVLRRSVQFEDIEPKMQKDCDEDFERGVSSQSASHQPYLEPLSSRLLQQIRKRLRLEWLMDITLKDLIIQCVYLSILLIILNSRRSVNTAYRSALTVRNLFVNSNTRMEISKVKTSSDFYTYLHKTLVPAMEEVTATGERRHVTLGCNHHLVGPYRLRQLRDRNDTCTTIPEGFAKGCTTSLEDTDNYDTSWSPAPLTLNSSSPWVYREPNQLNTMSFPGILATYPGSGYVVNMSADVKQHHDMFASLEKTGWFDGRTRAVLLEFSLYNPSVDMFNVVVILFEHASIGSVFPKHYIYTTSMFRYMDDSEMYVFICEILFLALSIIFAYIQIGKCRKVGRKTYISDAWNWAELVQIALSFAAVTLFIHRYVIVEEVLSSFKRGQGKTFVNFYPIVGSDLAIDYVTACLLSVLILKVLKLLQFHWRMKLISETLFHVRSPLLNFFFLFFIVILAFSHSSYLIFQKALSPFRDFMQSLLSNICMLTRNADVNVITENFQVLGNLFVLLFIVFVIYCMATVYAVILNTGRIQVRDAARRQRNKFALNKYIMNRLRVIVGIK